METYILAHDLGTTGDKATLVGTEGKLIASSFAAYPTYYPKQGWAEQNPHNYWRAFCESTRALLEERKVDPASIAVVAFSTQMMSALPIGRGPSRSAISSKVSIFPRAPCRPEADPVVLSFFPT
jgi:xylulokinase